MALKNKFVPLLKKGIQKILDLGKIVEYESDLSGSYTDRTLVDKEYVDNKVISGVTASNGLTEVGTDIQLGGTLTSDTTISSNEGKDRSLTIDLVNIDTNKEGYVDMYPNYAEYSIYDNNTNIYSTLEITSDDISIIHNNDVKASFIKLDNSQILITDTINYKGAEYNADYSANYTNRSLIDKEYVDSAITNSIFWTQVNDGGIDYLKPIATHNIITFGTGDDKGWISGDNGMLRMGADVVDMQASSGLGFSSSQIDMKGQLRLDTQNNNNIARIYTNNLTGTHIFEFPDYGGDIVVADNTGVSINDVLAWNGTQWATTTASALTDNLYTANGTLTSARTVDANGFGLNFHNNWIDYVINDDSSAIIADNGGSRGRFDIEPNFFQMYAQNNATFAGATVNGADSGTLTLTANTTGAVSDQMRLLMGTNQVDIITGSTTFKGATYDKDYSANYINRSLVDKSYVDKNLYLPATTITSDYTALITDKIVEIDTTSNAVTLTLPTLTTSDNGKQFIIDVYNADNTITLVGPNGLNDTLVVNETRTYVWYSHRNEYRRIN